MRRRRLLAAAILGGLLVSALIALALGADALSLVLGVAAAAVALALLALLANTPASAGRRARRDARAARAGNGKGARRAKGTAGEKGSRGGTGPHAAEREARVQGRRIIEAVDSAEARLFSQLEALDWLRAELQLRRPLPPTRGYAAAPDALAELVRIIDERRPDSVLELGSGVSSIVLARRLQQAGRGRLVALEHLPEHAERTRAELAAQGLADVATVLDAPLEDVVIGTDSWSWYRLGAGVPPAIDALFVDGPPASTGTLARYPALPRLADRLTPGATVFVDDGDRPDEREMVRRWQAEQAGLEARYLALAKGAWLLTVSPG